MLKLVEEDLAQPKAGEVRVRILATGVSFADILMRRGLYRPVPPLPYAPGYDIVGVLEGGRKVAALTVTGGYAQYMNLPESELVAIPEGVDDAEAGYGRHKGLSPSIHAENKRAFGEFFIVRFNHASDSAAFEGLAHLELGHVGLTFVHAPAHVWIDGHVDVPDEHLPGAGIGEVDLCERKTFQARFSLRTTSESNFATLSNHEGSIPRRGRSVGNPSNYFPLACHTSAARAHRN